MAILCEDLNLLYLCTEKTGSTSVSDTLLDQLGGRWVPRDHIWDGEHIAVDHKHSSALELVEYDVLTDEAIRGMRLAITVRNPFAWVLSGYRYRRKVLAQARELGAATPQWIVSRHEDLRRAEADFDTYVDGEVALRDGSMVHRYLDGFRGHPDLTYMKIETIDTDLNHLLGRCGVGWRIEIPRVNTTDGGGYRSAYSDRSRRAVEEGFALDLEMHGYEF